MLNKNKLQLGLQEFGLNPKDWRLRHLKEDMIHLTHKNSSKMSLLGFCSDKGDKWEHMYLF